MLNIKFDKVVETRLVKTVNRFPCLGQNIITGAIVAFFSESNGIVVQLGNDLIFHVGDVRTDWLPGYFRYMDSGTSLNLTITNE
ncbi:MAG: hypothetical protein M0R48_09615 [Candidatus Omnitrophica bacterium]|jgi:hypothetical protein|nr:hypothetical protein [Candidatus Omnitrophota bacterium]